MAGVKGRSGGRNRLSVEEHLLRGTFQRSRHGHLLTAGSSALQPASGDSWQPSPGDLKGLSVAGKRFLREMLEHNDATMADGYLLVEGAHAVDALAAIRALRGKGLAFPEQVQAKRLELAWSKQFAAILAQLQVRS